VLTEKRVERCLAVIVNECLLQVKKSEGKRSHCSIPSSSLPHRCSYSTACCLT